jgi:hypothetical protein
MSAIICLIFQVIVTLLPLLLLLFIFNFLYHFFNFWVQLYVYICNANLKEKNHAAAQSNKAINYTDFFE